MPALKAISVLRKARQWWRIGWAVRTLKRVNADEREFAQRALANALGDARGLAMKIGQFMAGMDDDISPYHQLVVSVEPIPLSVMKPLLEKQLKQPVEAVFQSIDEAIAAASLGQVHHALRLDGTEVAIKMRYPGIVAAVKADLALSDRLPAGGPVKKWRINTDDYKNALRRQLLRETDYLLEMQTQLRFKGSINVPGLHIPTIYPELCTDAVLVQSWETGERFNVVCTWPKKDRLEIGRTLLMTLFQSLFVNGEIHGDPHPGNYLFRHNNGTPQTVLLDFGCTVFINKQNRLALLKLIDFCRHGGENCDLSRCFVAMGFDAEKLSHLHADLPQLCDVLFQPFLVDRPFPLDQWQLGASLKKLLDERRWWFRTAGPADLFLLLRAFHGLSQQLEKLDIALPWWPLLQHVVGEQLLEQARNLELPAVDEFHPPNEIAYDRARKLCVRLQENNTIRISVDLPAEAAFDLESIIPSQVLLMLVSHSDINFIELSQRLRKEGLLAQTLCDFTTGEKHCQIWLA